MDKIRRKGFFDLCNLLNKYKRVVTVTEILKAVIDEGWFSDFKRLGYNTVIRQINNHNAKYGCSDMIEYEEH